MPESKDKKQPTKNRLTRFVYTETDLVEIFVDTSLSDEKKLAKLQKKSDNTNKNK